MSPLPGRRPVSAADAGAWLREGCVGPVGQLPAWLADAEAVRLAREHSLAPRLGSRIEAQGDPAGAGREPWREVLVSEWRRALGERALWDELLGELGEAGVQRGLPLVVLKGGDIARRLYGPGERPHNDLDLLVAPERLDEACALLGALGMREDHPDPATARTGWFATTWRDERRPRRQVDLHWALGPRARVRWTAAQLIERAEPFPGVAGLSRLRLHELIAHLALHAVAFHGAAGRWLWWLDLRLALERVDDAPRLVETARAAGGRVALAAALARCAQLFGGSRGVDAEAGGGARARLIARLGAALETRQESGVLSGLGRRLVAALAVDRPASLGLIARDVIAREARRRGRARSA